MSLAISLTANGPFGRLHSEALSRAGAAVRRHRGRPAPDAVHAGTRDQPEADRRQRPVRHREAQRGAGPVRDGRRRGAAHRQKFGGPGREAEASGLGRVE